MVNFPSSFDTNDTLFLAVNNKRTELTAPIDSVTLTIPVASTAGFPASGYITILTGTDPVDAEAIYYTSLGPAQFNAATRGAGGTTAASHNSGDNVDLTVVAEHHNSLKDAVIELEHFVGVSGSENFLRVDDVGNVSIPGGLTIIGTTAGGKFIMNNASAQTLVVSGTLVAGTSVFGPTSTNGLTVTGTAAIDRIVAASGSYSQSLTVSGSPVATGTRTLVSGTYLTGSLEFRATGDMVLHTSGQIITWSGYGVRRTGDQMSGDLDMQGNLVRRAGVVEVSSTAPTVTAAGMVWYSTTSGTTYVRVGSDWVNVYKYPHSTSTSFTTASVADSGGTLQTNQAFVNRALITKLTVSPVNPAANSTIIEFFTHDTYTSNDLEYRATTSGSFTDNDTWYHRDKDGSSELHLKLTNNSVTPTAFDVTLEAEVFA